MLARIDTHATGLSVSAVERLETVNLSRWVEGFLLAKRAEGLAATTARIYRKCLGSFTSYCERRNVTTIEGVDAGLIREFLLWLAETHDPGGVHQFYRVVKSFLRWWESEAAPDGWRNPVAKVHAPKLPQVLLEPVSLEHVAAMLKVCGMGRHAVRDRAVILTLLDTGLRASELTALDVADVDIITGAVVVRCGKGKKSRAVFMGHLCRRAVRKWLTRRGDEPGPLFTGNEGRRLNYRGLHSLLYRRCDDAAIPRVSPHFFRRAFTINSLKNGCDLLTLQRLLGHSNLSLLERYAKQNTDDLQAVHARTSPADRL